MLEIHPYSTTSGGALALIIGKFKPVYDACHFQSTFSGAVEGGPEQ